MTDRETHGNRQAITSEFMGIVGFGDLSSDAIGALNIIDHKAAILRANLAERDERIDELEAALAELTMVAIDMRAAISRLESTPSPGWDSAIKSAMDETGEVPDD